MHARRGFPRTLGIGAIAVGLGAGSYGVAAAATGTGTTATPSTPSVTGGPAPPAAGGQPWGGQRSDETPLTGDALAKVTALARAKVPNGTLVRVETDADGHAAYEAHMTDSSGTPVTVYVDTSFQVVSVETR
jgi:hypothetical protein